MKKASAIIIENKKKELLLILRDNIFWIPYPNHWSLVGGLADKNETPKETVIREAMEEINYDVSGCKFFKTFKVIFLDISIFWKKGDFNLKKFKLGDEGQELRFFSLKEIEDLKMIPSHKRMIMEFYNGKQQSL